MTNPRMDKWMIPVRYALLKKLKLLEEKDKLPSEHVLQLTQSNKAIIDNSLIEIRQTIDKSEFISEVRSFSNIKVNNPADLISKLRDIKTKLDNVALPTINTPTAIKFLLLFIALDELEDLDYNMAFSQREMLADRLTNICYTEITSNMVANGIDHIISKINPTSIFKMAMRVYLAA